ncbi:MULTISPECIES: hypothetical protein [unclassified Mesorhizobium]|uniref:hypothetical protein n=1 Tax=unclassified Mesorhizobium TaxID=325217 RepID=UPI00333D35F6
MPPNINADDAPQKPVIGWRSAFRLEPTERSVRKLALSSFIVPGAFGPAASKVRAIIVRILLRMIAPMLRTAGRLRWGHTSSMPAILSISRARNASRRHRAGETDGTPDLAIPGEAVGHRRVPMIHRAGEMHVEDERHATRFAEPPVSERGTCGVHELRRRGLVTVY